MRKFLAAVTTLTAAFVLIQAEPCEAGSRGYYMCWTTIDGYSDCANLPSNFSIPGVTKPYCSSPGRCPNGQAEFVLTRARIAHLRRYADTSTMVPTHDAVIYAP
jgi:hypothetical protein